MRIKMGLYTDLPDDIDEVDIIIAGGKSKLRQRRLRKNPIPKDPATKYLSQAERQDAS